MNSISSEVKSLLTASVGLLNQSLVKEGIKNIVGTVTFVFGLVGFYDSYQIARGRKIATEVRSDCSKWIEVANKVITFCAQISLILSGGVSRPGIFIISSLVGCAFSISQLNRVFGPNTTFAMNPWHPRHVVSIAAVILALPKLTQSSCEGINGAYKRIRQHENRSTNRLRTSSYLIDLKLMNLFNTATSRPVLHLVNQWGRFIILSKIKMTLTVLLPILFLRIQVVVFE